MKSLLNVLACAVLAVIGATIAVRAGDAPQAGPIHVTAFFEVTPGSANQAIGMLKQYRDAAKAETGARSVQLYQEVGAPFRFVSAEVWQDMAAYQAHAKASSTTGIVERMKAVEFGPPDMRRTPSTSPPRERPCRQVHHRPRCPRGIPQLPAMTVLRGSSKQPVMLTYRSSGRPKARCIIFAASSCGARKGPERTISPSTRMTPKGRDRSGHAYTSASTSRA